MSDKVYIYSISDPRDGKVFYIGATTNPSTRWAGHVSAAKYNKYKTGFTRQRSILINEILSIGLYPVFTILIETTIEQGPKSERVTINKLLSEGATLIQNPMQCYTRSASRQKIV